MRAGIQHFISDPRIFTSHPENWDVMQEASGYSVSYSA